MRRIVRLFLIIALSYTCEKPPFSPYQELSISTFEVILGGKNPDAAINVIELSNRNIIVSGYGDNLVYLLDGTTGIPLDSFAQGNGDEIYWFQDLIGLDNDEFIACGFKGPGNKAIDVIVKMAGGKLEIQSELVTPRAGDFLMKMVRLPDGEIAFTGINFNDNNKFFLSQATPSLSRQLAYWEFANVGVPRSLIYTSDRSLLIGTSRNQSSDLIVKMDKNSLNTVDWTVSLNDFLPTRIIELSDKNYLVIGMEDNSPAILLFSPSGQKMKGQKLDNLDGHFVDVVFDNEFLEGLVFLGRFQSARGDQDIFLMKVGASFNIESPIFMEHFGSKEFDDFGSDLIRSADGGFIIVGGTRDPVDGENDMYVIKTDENGKL